MMSVDIVRKNWANKSLYNAIFKSSLGCGPILILMDMSFEEVIE